MIFYDRLKVLCERENVYLPKLLDQMEYYRPGFSNRIVSGESPTIFELTLLSKISNLDKMDFITKKVTIKDVAKRLGVNVQYVRLHLEDGSIPVGTVIKHGKNKKYIIDPFKYCEFFKGETLW